ncbi:unnamed protein product [Closterium sp. NIES-54]
MDTSDPVVFASVATAALVLFLFIWRIVFFFTADADLTLLLKGPPPEGAFEDKVVWITGASQGIGQELAQRFAAMGARLILSSRSADRLEAVRATCRGKHAPEGVVVLPFDLKGGADVLRGAVRQAESAFRGEGACGGGEEPCGVDVLVLNAAHPRPKLTCEDTPEDTLRGMLEVNVVATIELTRYLLPGMMQRNKGQILVVSSAAGKLPAPTQGVYAATKHALHGYFNTLRYEAVQHGVAVTLVCPGPIATEGSAEGAVKLATKPSADQLHVPAAAGGDEKPVLLLMYLAQYFPANCSPQLLPSTAPLNCSPQLHNPPPCPCALPPPFPYPPLSPTAGAATHPVLLLLYLRQYFPATGLYCSKPLSLPSTHTCLSTAGAATHVPRTVFPCYLQHALQQGELSAVPITQGDSVSEALQTVPQNREDRGSQKCSNTYFSLFSPSESGPMQMQQRVFSSLALSLTHTNSLLPLFPPLHLSDWPKESASTQDRQQQHVFDEPTIHPHILFLFLLTHLSFLLPPLDLLYLFPQPFTLPHTPTPCNPSTPQVPIFPIPHPHTFPHTLTHTSAKVYHPLPSFLPSSLLFPSLLPLLSISLPLIPLTRPLSPPFTHLGPSPPLLA